MVENVGGTFQKSHSGVGLTYDTTPERIEEALALLTDIVPTTPRRRATTPFGSAALEIRFEPAAIYYIRKGEHWAHVPGEVNLAILNRFNAAGLTAFPTQTLLHEGLPGA